MLRAPAWTLARGVVLWSPFVVGTLLACTALLPSFAQGEDAAPRFTAETPDATIEAAKRRATTTKATEAAQISEEYRADFGAQLKPPATITSFRYKTGAKAKKPAAAA